LRVFEGVLAALKNADLPSDYGGVPGMTLKIAIVANISLEAIESGKFGDVIGHSYLPS